MIHVLSRLFLARVPLTMPPIAARARAHSRVIDPREIYLASAGAEESPAACLFRTKRNFLIYYETCFYYLPLSFFFTFSNLPAFVLRLPGGK